MCKSEGWSCQDNHNSKFRYWISEKRQKILLIDNDPQGSLTQSLGCQEPDKLEVTLAEIMDWVLNEEKFDLGAGIIHHEEGVDILPGNIELSGVETSLVGIMSSETVLREYIEMIDDRYDHILMGYSKSHALKNSHL